MCLFFIDVPTPPTEREVVGFTCLFRRWTLGSWPPGSIRVGETASKEKLDLVGGAKMATSCLLGEGLPHIPAKLVAKIQKDDFVDMAELYGITWRQRGGLAKRMVPVSQAGNQRRVGGRCLIY